MTDAESYDSGSIFDTKSAESTPFSSDNGSAEAEKDYCFNGDQATESHTTTCDMTERPADDVDYQERSGTDQIYGNYPPDEFLRRRTSQLSSLLDDEFVDPDQDLDPNDEKVARAKVQQYSKYIHLMEEQPAGLLERLRERVGLLESKIKKIETTPETVDATKPRLREQHKPAIPDLHFVKWFDFKHKYEDEKDVYAIEVLVGSARFFYQYKTDEQTRKSASRGAVYEIDSLPSDRTTYTPNAVEEMPERIRINSHPLLAILSHISAKEWSLRPRVFLRPYKLFVHYDKEIRDFLANLEARWAEPNQASRGGVKSMQPCPNGNNNHCTEIEVQAQHIADFEPTAQESSGSSNRTTANLGVESPNGHESKAGDHLADLLESREALSDLRCLVRFMDRYLILALRRFNGASIKKVTFDDLWYLFKPGDEVFAPAPKVNTIEMGDKTAPEKSRRSNRYQEAWRVLHVTGGRPALTADEETKPLMESRPHDFTMICYYLDFNGVQIGPAVCSFIIKPFESAVDITSLEVYPWRYVPNGAAIRERLRKEGELFRDYTDVKHLHYDGTSLTHHPCGRPVQVKGMTNHPESIEGRVIVGFAEGVQIDPGWLTPIGFPDEFKQYSSEVVEHYPIRLWANRDQVTSTDSWNDLIHHDYSIDKLRHVDLVESDPFLKAWESRFFSDDAQDEQELRDEDLILLPSRVLAYVFRERRFALLRLNQLRKCRADPDGFQNLKLLRGYKKMVKSLVLTHFLKKKVSQNFGLHDSMGFDVVHGKSKGLVFLLHGVPGVGKTSTAECVAEATGKPLFPITCGDLGLSPESVEKTLREIFHLAQLWDCILLLDEADIFLAQRTRTDLKRNALVSVFLRILEYYSGILFLTTNRVGVIDEAFKSRIHVTLLYPELTEYQTHLIWSMNLDRLRKIDRERAERTHDPEMVIDEKAIMDYQKRHYQECRKMNRSWNGRQIRNAFQTASALALFDAHNANISRLNDEAEIEKAVPELKVDYFEKVSVASSNFDLYISETAGVGGKNEGERARDRGDRADHLRFTGGNPLEPGSELRSAPSNNMRRTSGTENFRSPQGPPPYSGINALHEHGNAFGSSSLPRAPPFSAGSNYFDARHPPNGAGMYDYAGPQSNGMPLQQHPSRQHPMHGFDDDDDEE